jgi:GNAT superfamily N-acetyltransferase
MLRVKPDDEKLIRACHAVHTAASETDDPAMPPLSYPAFAALTSVGWTGDPSETWLAPDRESYLIIRTPDRENTRTAIIDIAVHPDRRRQGTGTALLSFASKRCESLDRSTIATAAWTGSPGEEFIRRYGTPGISQVRRVLRVTRAGRRKPGTPHWCGAPTAGSSRRDCGTTRSRRCGARRWRR